MIYQKPTIFFLKKTGAFFLLIFIVFTNLKAAENISLDDLNSLGDSFSDENNHFLSYFYYNSAFKLSKDSSFAVSCGFKALHSAILANRVMESSLLKNQLSIRFPTHNREISDYYQYHLVRRKDLKTLTALNDSTARNKPQMFLQAYAAFVLGNSVKRDSLLEKIDDFPLQNEIADIRQDLKLANQLPQKSKLLAATASSILPGSGQLYCGSLFDAMTNFGFCSVSGIAVYSSWSYELTKSHSERNYTLPIYSTLSFAVFYIANIYNALNGTERFNLFQQKEYMEKIDRKFEVIISNDKLFIKINL